MNITNIENNMKKNEIYIIKKDDFYHYNLNQNNYKITILNKYMIIELK